ERLALRLVFYTRFDPATHAERGERRRIAGAAMRDVDARDVLRDLADHLHVFEAGSAVFRGDVVAAEGVDETAERPEERDAIEVLRGADEHALAAAVRETCERRLVRHAAREAERVDERVFVRVVREEPASAERGPEPRVVHGDDGLEARRLVELEMD